MPTFARQALVTLMARADVSIQVAQTASVSPWCVRVGGGGGWSLAFRVIRTSTFHSRDLNPVSTSDSHCALRIDMLLGEALSSQL